MNGQLEITQQLRRTSNMKDGSQSRKMETDDLEETEMIQGRKNLKETNSFKRLKEAIIFVQPDLKVTIKEHHRIKMSSRFKI